MHTPHPENRATAVLTPFPGIPASAENPDSRSAGETPTDYPVPAARGSTPVQYLDRVGGRRSAKTPHAAGIDSSIIKRLCRMHRLKCIRHISIIPLD